MTKQKRPTGKNVSAALKPQRATKVAKAKPASKLEQLEAMLRRPDGATIAQLTKALSWQAHSIRGAMSGSLKKKLGLKIAADKVEGADRVYRIAG